MHLNYTFKARDLLLLSAAVLFAISLAINKLQMHLLIYDTYIITDRPLIFRFFGVYLVICWLVYFATKKLLFSQALSWAHILTNIICATLVIYLFYYESTILKTKDSEQFKNFSDIDQRLMLFLSILILSHIIFLVNLVTGLIAKLR